VTRWQIGGSGGGDSEAPPAPSFFGLAAAPSGGVAVLSGVSFASLTDTQTISAGTLTLHYWDEVQTVNTFALENPISDADTTIALNAAGPAHAGDMIQVDAEVMQVSAISTDGLQYTVNRGMHGTAAVQHGAAAGVFHLSTKTIVTPFPEGFFGSPYSGSWSFPIVLPDVRIASAELFVTNRVGSGPALAVALTHSADSGLRTFGGGQYSLQVDGFLAVDVSATPVVSVDSACSVRDVYGILGTAADAAVQFQVNVDGAPYCQCTFQPGMTVSSSVSGFGLPALQAQSKLTLSVLSVGQIYPGADLTVVVRL